LIVRAGVRSRPIKPFPLRDAASIQHDLAKQNLSCEKDSF
jgi:hypothetical protein